MSELLLVNPRRRHRRRARVTSVRRNPRRRRKMTALQAQYFGGGRKRRTHRRRRARSSVAVAAPRRHRRRRSFKSFLRNTSGSVRSFNPSSFFRDTLLPSGIGAIGALGVDVALGYASPYLPSFMTTGIGVPLTKIAGAVALGMVASAVTNRRVGEQVMAGAITVVLYNTLRTQVQANFPSITLAGHRYMGYAGPALAFPDRMSGMGMYVDGGGSTIPPAVVAAIAQQAAGKTAPSAATMGEYVGSYESQYNY